MITIVHIITGLEQGGAEATLCKLVRKFPADRYTSHVVSLTSAGVLGRVLRQAGITLDVLDMRRGIPDPRILFRLAHLLRARRPDIVQTWMYHADLLGGLAARMAGVASIVWGIRQSDLDPAHSKRLTRMTARVCALLSSRVPHRIVSCSRHAMYLHMDMGYAPEKMLVIPNGFDLNIYRPDTTARSVLRAELSIEADQPVIGMIARFDPQKDHRTFVDAAAKLLQMVPGAIFLLAGDGVDWNNRQLTNWIEAAGGRRRFILLGSRSDIPRILNVLDIATLSSAFGEGFPNVIGEAMACEVPCVVTDVGDSAELVGDTGRVVASRDPAALASAWAELLHLDIDARRTLGRASRARVQSNFQIDVVAAKYAALYETLVSARAMQCAES